MIRPFLIKNLRTYTEVHRESTEVTQSQELNVSVALCVISVALCVIDF